MATMTAAERLEKKRQALLQKKEALKKEAKAIQNLAYQARKKARNGRLFVLGLILEKMLRTDGRMFDLSDLEARHVLTRDCDKLRYAEASKLIKAGKGLDSLEEPTAPQNQGEAQPQSVS